MRSPRMPNSNPEARLPTVSSEDFLPPIAPWLSLGGWVLVVMVGAAFVLAAVVRYGVTVKAAATLRPSGELRIVEAAREGTVEQIEVKENQTVQAGEAIARLDDSRLQLQKRQLSDRLGQLQRQFLQINAQIAALDRQLAAETEGNRREIASATAQLEGRNREYRDRQQTSQQAVEEAEADLMSARAELRAAEARLRSTEAALQAARARVQRYSPIAAIGAISRDLWEETQLAVEQQEADRAVQTQNIERQKQAVEAAKARLAKARTALDPSSTEVAIARQQIARQQATGEAMTATLKRERESLIEQRIEIQKQRDRDRRELQQIEADLQQTVILAPTDGTILQLQLRNSSQIVQSGEEIAQISPQNAPLAIEALVAAADIRRVEVGQTAQIRISACPYPDYGTLAGTVKAISPDTFPNNDSPATFYKVTLQPQNTIFGRGGARCALQAGMEGRADILADKETVLRLLLRQARLVADL